MPRHESITWTTLLAHFTALAKASLSLPKDASGDRWRAAVPAIVSLQAVTHALGELDAIDEPSTIRPRKTGGHSRDNGGGGGERAVALDKAEILIRRDSHALRELWGHQPLHAELAEIIADANAAYEAALDFGYEWSVVDEALIAEHPADVVEELLAAGFSGDLYVPAPGVMLFESCPAAWLHPKQSAPDQTDKVASRGPNQGGIVDDAMLRIVTEFLKGAGVPLATSRPGMGYRQFDFAKGGPVRDVVVEFGTSPPGGQALLVPAILNGEAQPVSLPPRKTEPMDPLPVVFQDESEAD